LDNDQDPYLYPGTATLRNRLGLKDDGPLNQAERMLIHARGREAARMAFPLDADGYRALHKHLFQDLYDWAGQDRTINIGKEGSLFAHASYIANGLSAVFKDLAAQDNLTGLSREEFFDRLGHHVNELNAVHPFREGNGRTMRHHAVQLAGEAGHSLRINGIDKQAWMDASRHGFTTGDHRLFSAVLAAAAHEQGEPALPRTGPGGMAFLPPRDPPTGQRYRLSLEKVRGELERYLPAARTEAAERLQRLVKDAAPDSQVAAARTELAYMRHAKGPVYQSHLLTYLGQRDVDAVISAQQTPLQRVREIGAALATRINGQQPAHIQRAVRSLERPVLPPGQSPAHERLADTFLKNLAEQNRGDPRLAGAQAIVDRVQAASRDRGDGSRLLEGTVDAARTSIAANIRAGRPFDDGMALQSQSGPKPPAPDKGRSR
jgi:cell filamentation protein